MSYIRTWKKLKIVAKYCFNNAKVVVSSSPVALDEKDKKLMLAYGVNFYNNKNKSLLQGYIKVTDLLDGKLDKLTKW